MAPKRKQPKKGSADGDRVQAKKASKKAKTEKQAIANGSSPSSADESPTSIARLNLKYPSHLTVDFKQLQTGTLRKYAELQNLKAAPDLAHDELAILVARHFDNYLNVDEDDSIATFCKRVRASEDWKEYGFDITAMKKGLRESTKRKKKNSRKRQEQLDDEMEQQENGKGGKTVLYCICRQRDYGEMIACENKTCLTPNEWYHLPCIGLEVVPKSKWFCPICREGAHSDDNAESKKKKSNSPTKKK